MERRSKLLIWNAQMCLGASCFNNNLWIAPRACLWGLLPRFSDWALANKALIPRRLMSPASFFPHVPFLWIQISQFYLQAVLDILKGTNNRVPILRLEQFQFLSFGYYSSPLYSLFRSRFSIIIRFSSSFSTHMKEMWNIDYSFPPTLNEHWIQYSFQIMS